VVLAVKTPLAFLLLWIAGAAGFLRRRAEWPKLALAFCAPALLAVVMTSHINLGVRHILPIYAFMAPVAGFAVVALWNSDHWRIGSRLLASALMTWLVLSSLLAHPDYMAYFNELVGDRPERVLAESDLDWGQDLRRLTQQLDKFGVREVSIAYWGSADLSRAGRQKFIPLSEGAKGWIAISVHFMAMPHNGEWPRDWLPAHRRVERIGKSILLYHPQ
jgi:hypothetical protein